MSVISDQIHEKCTGCAHGYDDSGRTVCTHHFHPGRVGGFGTEWALTCSHFTPDGRKGHIEHALVRTKR